MLEAVILNPNATGGAKVQLAKRTSSGGKAGPLSLPNRTLFQCRNLCKSPTILTSLNHFYASSALPLMTTISAAGIVARPSKPVTLMYAGRLRQGVFRSKEVNSARGSEIIGIEGLVRPILRRTLSQALATARTKSRQLKHPEW